jgi:hypothetical protein
MGIRQGDLDGLCGVYSIINALSVISDFNQTKRQDLFYSLVNKLNHKYDLAEIIRYGMDNRKFRVLFRQTQKYCTAKLKKNVTIKPVFSKVKTITLSEYCKQIDTILTSQNTAIIIRMSGAINHWTCIRSISEKCIYLEDSGEISHLRLSSCQVGDKDKTKRHSLWHKETWSVTID